MPFYSTYAGLLLLVSLTSANRQTQSEEKATELANVGRNEWGDRQLHNLNATESVELYAPLQDKELDRPLVVNRAHLPLVVYIQRGFLFNKQVIWPGEAAQLFSAKWGPRMLAYSVVALVGDENQLPSRLDSLVNSLGIAAVPTAFVVAALGSALTLGAMTGPSIALVPMVVGLTAAGGGAAVGGAKLADLMEVDVEDVAEKVVISNPKVFMTKKSWIHPGIRYLEVTGGPGGPGGRYSNLEMSEMTFEEYADSEPKVAIVKPCIEARSDVKMEKISFDILECGDKNAVGKWTQTDMHKSRPRYQKDSDEDYQIQWSAKSNAWRMFHNNFLGIRRTTLYHAAVNSFTVPVTGWEVASGESPVPSIELGMSTHDQEEETAEDGEDSDDE